jgi:aconitate hydratase
LKLPSAEQWPTDDDELHCQSGNVTAFALAGWLSFNPLRDTLLDSKSESFRLSPPGPAPEVPATSFIPGQATYIAPPDDGSSIKVNVDPKSKRLQLMVPWKA